MSKVQCPMFWLTRINARHITLDFGPWTLDSVFREQTEISWGLRLRKAPATRMAPATEDQMFSNLIESSSHRSEFKRRGSFFLFTTASYALLFVIAGVVSIYAYDARMEDQSLELVTMMPLIDLPRPERQATVVRPTSNTPKSPDGKQTYFERKEAIARVDDPKAAPDTISTTPNPGLPMPRVGIVVFNGHDSDPSQPGDSDSRTSG